MNNNPLNLMSAAASGNAEVFAMQGSSGIVKATLVELVTALARFVKDSELDKMRKDPHGYFAERSALLKKVLKAVLEARRRVTPPSAPRITPPDLSQPNTPAQPPVFARPPSQIENDRRRDEENARKEEEIGTGLACPTGLPSAEMARQRDAVTTALPAIRNALDISPYAKPGEIKSEVVAFCDALLAIKDSTCNAHLLFLLRKN